jgi:hypothetical protein
MKSLFNEEIPEVPIKKGRGHFKDWRQRHHYRKANGEQRCGNCRHRLSGAYHKCRLQGGSNSAASDIRLSNVCDEWNATEGGRQG